MCHISHLTYTAPCKTQCEIYMRRRICRCRKIYMYESKYSTLARVAPQKSPIVCTKAFAKVDYTSFSRPFRQSSFMRIRACASDISILDIYIYVQTDIQVPAIDFAQSTHQSIFNLHTYTNTHTYTRIQTRTQTHTSFSYNKISPTYPPARAPPPSTCIRVCTHLPKFPCPLRKIIHTLAIHTQTDTQGIHTYMYKHTHNMYMVHMYTYVYAVHTCLKWKAHVCMHTPSCLMQPTCGAMPPLINEFSSPHATKHASAQVSFFFLVTLSPQTHTYPYIHTRT
jgi:hypothetical protein